MEGKDSTLFDFSDDSTLSWYEETENDPECNLGTGDFLTPDPDKNMQLPPTTEQLKPKRKPRTRRRKKSPVKKDTLESSEPESSPAKKVSEKKPISRKSPGKKFVDKKPPTKKVSEKKPISRKPPGKKFVDKNAAKLEIQEAYEKLFNFGPGRGPGSNIGPIGAKNLIRIKRFLQENSSNLNPHIMVAVSHGHYENFLKSNISHLFGCFGIPADILVSLAIHFVHDFMEELKNVSYGILKQYGATMEYIDNAIMKSESSFEDDYVKVIRALKEEQEKGGILSLNVYSGCKGRQNALVPFLTKFCTLFCTELYFLLRTDNVLPDDMALALNDKNNTFCKIYRNTCSAFFTSSNDPNAVNRFTPRLLLISQAARSDQ